MTDQIRARAEEKQSNTAETERSTGKGWSRKPAQSTRSDEHPDLESINYPLLRQQRTHGNQAVQRLVNERIRPTVQPKLEVGKPDNKYEREADRVAEQIMQMPESIVRPTCASRECREEVPLSVQRKVEAATEAPLVPSQSSVVPSGGHSLDQDTRSFFEQRFGHDFGDVRIHEGPHASDLARSLQARAYTVGRDVVFGEDQYQPQNRAGRQLLAHELMHTIQQRKRQNGHNLIQRYDWAGAEDFGMGEWAAERAEQERQQREHHAAWEAGVDRQFGRELSSQARTVSAERERIDFALTGQRAAAFDAVASGEGWLQNALQEQGYTGPTVLEVKQRWAEALVAAELLKVSSSEDEVATDARLHGLETISAFYHDIGILAPAIEEAHRAHVRSTNERLRIQYENRRREYEEGQRMDRMAYGPRGEPGEGAFRAGLALRRGAPPAEPNYLSEPPAISDSIPATSSRIDAAESRADWTQVAADMRRLDAGLSKLLVASLPQESETKQNIQYLTELDTRLAEFEGTHQVSFRIPAVFYPKDEGTTQTNAEGETEIIPKSIPWQFYLVNTGVPTRDQPARAGGEWVLIDLTSGRRFENRAPASDRDSAMLQQGAVVDPPIGMFSQLNSKIRFPEGRLDFMLPSGQTYKLQTTEPWSLSEFLAGLGIALAGIALTAGVIATGGAAVPAAVAFYAGLGSVAAGIGSTFAEMNERSQHGILTAGDVDRATIQIGIDLVGALSLGLGRLVTAPGAIARFGNRFVVLSRITQSVNITNLAGDAYQALTVTAGFVDAFNAIEKQPGLTDEQRDRMRGQLVRRALLTGAILTVALRGDLADIQSGRALHASSIDPDGALVVHGRGAAAHGEAETPSTRMESPGGPGAGRAPHADVEEGPVHASAREAGSGLNIGPQSHAVGVGGTGQRRGFYFCSDLCSPLAGRLRTILTVLPRHHPFRPAVEDMLARARRAGRQLRKGQLSQQDADAVARELSDRIQRLSNDSPHFAALMNTDPALLAAQPHAIRQRLRDDLEDRVAHLAGQSERQAANRGSSRGRAPQEPRDPRSPLETDILGGIDMSDVARPSRRQQPIHFDVGNFSHTYAEALVPSLPRGLHAEVPVTLPDGSVGRADRVRFIYDSDGDRIGAHVYEIKPNVGENVARGEAQVQGYVAGLRAEIESALRAKGKPIPTTAPEGGPLYRGQVVTYDYNRMLAVLRALRANRRDATNMSELEAIAKQVFKASGP